MPPSSTPAVCVLVIDVSSFVDLESAGLADALARQQREDIGIALVDAQMRGAGDLIKILRSLPPSDAITATIKKLQAIAGKAARGDAKRAAEEARQAAET